MDAVYYYQLHQEENWYRIAIPEVGLTGQGPSLEVAVVLLAKALAKYLETDLVITWHNLANLLVITFPSGYGIMKDTLEAALKAQDIIDNARQRGAKYVQLHVEE